MVYFWVKLFWNYIVLNCISFCFILEGCNLIFKEGFVIENFNVFKIKVYEIVLKMF